MEADISDDDPQFMSNENKEMLAQIIIALSNVCRVTRELESDQLISMPPTPRYSQEFYESLMIMAEKYKTHTDSVIQQLDH